jgi:hypothetical protein
MTFRAWCLATFCFGSSLWAQDVKQADVYRRIKATCDATAVVDTHDHLRPFELLPRDPTSDGPRVTLRSIWAASYYSWTSRVGEWPESQKFDDWWVQAKPHFVNGRATSFYRYMLPAWRDLYGVDFDTITDEQAHELNQRVIKNYADDKWERSVCERAKIELMLIDPYWARMDLDNAFPKYPFAVPVLNVTTIISAHHPGNMDDLSNPFWFASKNGLPIETFDDYLAVVSAIFDKAVAVRAVCLKSTQAYVRELRYLEVPKERAQKAWGKSPKEVTPEEKRDFEDYLFWHIVNLSARYDLPFQIHTGQARIQGSNPLLLADVIERNPRTKFILFHGGYPWVGETAVIAQRFKNVYIDSNWLPQLSYTMARRAYQEWLDAVPSNRILWGADNTYPEGIYGATMTMRRCIAEALAEKVVRDELKEEDAHRIARQILRDNALELFPSLRDRLWMKEE